MSVVVLLVCLRDKVQSVIVLATWKDWRICGQEFGAEVSKDAEKEIHRLAGRFFTERVLNVEAVGRTFKPLRKLKGELKIRDLGDSILVFDFVKGLDLERVLELEPWTYDNIW